jgi:hypothetical protein
MPYGARSVPEITQLAVVASPLLAAKINELIGKIHEKYSVKEPQEDDDA